MKKINDLTDEEESNRLHWNLMYQALRDGEVRGEDPTDPSFTREHVRNEIEAFIKACYNLSLNPLPKLRMMFPSYKWQSHKPKTYLPPEKFQHQLKGIKSADHVWESRSMFVTARKRP